MRSWSILVCALLIVWYAITSAEMIDLTNGGIDLGRHLKNGELLLSPSAPHVVYSHVCSYARIQCLAQAIKSTAGSVAG